MKVSLYDHSFLGRNKYINFGKLAPQEAYSERPSSPEQEPSRISLSAFDQKRAADFAKASLKMMNMQIDDTQIAQDINQVNKGLDYLI